VSPLMSRLQISTNRPPRDSNSGLALGGAGDRVEHDVQAIAVGVAAYSFGEL
jgi:hypothetical protein